MAQPFCLRLRVRYAECDAQQVVFNARYGDYVDLASTEFFREIIGGYDALLESGYDNQVVRLLTEWKAPARFDDVIDLFVWIESVGRTSFVLKVDMRFADSGEAIAMSEAVYVLLTRDAHEKTEVPDGLREQLLQGAPTVVVDQSGRRP